VEIRPFDPQDASELDLNHYVVVQSAARAADFPEDPALTYEAAVGQWRNPPLSRGDSRYWPPSGMCELAERDVEERVVAAIHTATGALVGVTGILNYPHRREFGYQNDTSVVMAHRGHGLGRALTAAMTRWIVAERPDIERIMTTTPTENSHMIAVNLSIGYDTIRTMNWSETTPARLAERLSR
jgi:RimJ/RimL family protein N-acetyltransferase